MSRRTEPEVQFTYAGDHQWSLAKRLAAGGNSRRVLEGWGFEILEEGDTFYKVTPPQGWKTATHNYYQDWIVVKDDEGDKRFFQFSGSGHEKEAFIALRILQ